MDINCYLAMTAADFVGAHTPPPYAAWMACHYSPTGKGLSNLPQQLPAGSLLMVDDSIPPNDHEPEWIAAQLKQLAENLSIDGIILDFQRTGLAENRELVNLLTKQPPCPICVSSQYAQGLNCAVFLPPPPLHTPLCKHLAPWKGKDIWLEAALETEQITITKEGSAVMPLSFTSLPEDSFWDDKIYCRYTIQVQEDRAIFTLTRNMDMLQKLLTQASKHGVSKAVGLYQELKCFL